MANHYQRSLELLDEVDAARTELRRHYLETPTPDRHKVADLHQTIGVCLKLAGIHATLAEAQSVTDLGSRFTA